MAQLEEQRPARADGSDHDTHRHDGIPHSGGPIMHRDDSWRDEVFDRHPSEFDPH